ncbi:hypothetical protein MLD38_020971 [Melastoma candidum]|uniref:Uncharacterized protein n=1 Tax=Melastoma candidum TaxID=119954 RepID=A0ACB9QI16_9MYRT|nr:hypothetical protein MLD38_020971 [Melastoma candidum]
MPPPSLNHPHQCSPPSPSRRLFPPATSSLSSRTSSPPLSAPSVPPSSTPSSRSTSLCGSGLEETEPETSGSVAAQPDHHTLIGLPGPVVVPGLRFREVLLMGLQRGTYGHVLNDAQVYYINISQPPLLSATVYAIYERTRDKEFVKEALPALVREFGFWTADNGPG